MYSEAQQGAEAEQHTKETEHLETLAFLLKLTSTDYSQTAGLSIN